MNGRTKALQISREVKVAVAERDSVDGWPCCVWCGKPAPVHNRTAFSNAHYIARSQGGMGIEKNILTLCPECHHAYDQTIQRMYMRKELRDYLRRCYPGWDDVQLTYRR